MVAHSLAVTGLQTEHRTALVVLSLLIAIAASYVAFDLVERTAVSRGRARHLWLLGGSVCLGVGMCSMHLVGLMAVRFPVAVRIEVPRALEGLAVGVVLAAGALLLGSDATRRATGKATGKASSESARSAGLPPGVGIWLGSLLFGAIALATHAIAVASIGDSVQPVVDPSWRVAGTLLAVLGARFALGLAPRGLAAAPRRAGHSARHLAAALALGTAMAGAHFLASIGTVYFPGPGEAIGRTPPTVGVTALGVLDLSILTFLFFGIAVVTTFFDRRFSARALSLRDSERRYRQLFERSLSGVYRSTLEGRLIDCNDAFGRILGYANRAECLNGSPMTLHYGDPKERAPFITWLRRDGRLTDFECRLQRCDGTAVWVLENAALLASEDGGEPVIEGTILDITARKEAEEALLRAIQSAHEASIAKSAFLANVSHEIRTPLNGIVGTTELALATGLDPQQREYLEIIQISADALLRIVGDVLDFSKIEAQKMTLDPVDFDLRAKLAEMVRPTAATARAKGLEFDLSIADDVPRGLRADVDRLRQILVNLLGNAVKFTPAGTISLEVTCHRGDDTPMLEFAVRDSGIGVPEEKLRTIFDPFTQVDGSTTRRFGGTGLGLAICAQLAELMGGRVWAESRPNEGSCFRLALPLTATERAARTGEFQILPALQVASVDLAPADGRSLRVLVAEDNAINQLVVQRMLEGRGHAVKVTEDGLAAVEAYSEGDYDVVLMDVQMPRMDGYEAASEIRRAERSRSVSRGRIEHLPIIALTAHAMTGDGERCRAAGMDGYLTKPLRAADLHQALEALVPRAGAGAAERAHEPAAVPLLDNAPLLREVFALFRTEAPRLLSEIRARVQARDGRGLFEAAHALRGCVGNFDARSASTAALALEVAGRHNDFHSAGPTLARLERDIVNLERELALATQEACA
jgi:PAS domain S-box-containing protein